MAENVIDLIGKIAQARGQDYAEGMVDLANLLIPAREERKEEKTEKAHA